MSILRKSRNNRFLSVCLTVSLLTLSGCSWIQDVASNIGDMASGVLPPLSETHEEKSVAAPEEQSWGQDYDAISKEQAEMRSVMAQPRGLNDTPLTEPEIRQRLENVEMALVELRREIDKTVPAFEKLMVIDQKISALSAALHQSQKIPETIPDINAPYNPALYSSQVAAVPQVAQISSHASPQILNVPRENLQQQPKFENLPTPVVKPSSVSPSKPYDSVGPSVQNIRFGEHNGRTRLVLDLTAPVAFSHDLDNNEKILVLELPGTKWNTTKMAQVSRSSLILSYSVQDGNQGGSRLVLQLKKPVRVRTAEALKPTGVKGHRVFIDLVAQ